MRILLLNPEFPPIGGGGANACSHILREMSEEPHLEMDVVTASDTGKFYRLKVGSNIQIHRLPIRKESLFYWKQSEMLAYVWRAYWYSRKLMRLGNYDLCHAFFGFPSGLVSWALRRRLPYLVSLRGSDVPGFNERFSWHYVPLVPLFKQIWRRARYVAANSEGLRELALRTDSSRPIGVIPNGVDTRLFHPPERRDSDRLTLITVCRFVGRKGIPYLIRAMPAIVAANPKVRLRIVGDGERREEWETLVREIGMERSIEFTGHKPHEQLAALLRESHIFVLPSLYEGMSNTLLEAIASGLPVIVTDTGGTRELVDQNGIVVAQRDPDDIARAVLEIAGCDTRRMDMGARSCTIARHYSWENVARQYIELYRKIIAEYRG